MTASLDASGEAPLAFDIATILDHGAWLPRQKVVLGLVSLVAMADGIDAQVLSLALPQISADWDVPRSAFAIVLALNFVAMAVGAASGGYAGDRFGRKIMLVGATATFGICTLAGAFTHGIFSMGLLRCIAALGLGAAMPNVATIVAEYTPIRQRSVALGLAMSGLPIGGVALGMIAAFTLPRFGWEALFVVAGIVPLFIALALCISLPESLRFLVRKPANRTKIAKIIATMHALPPSVESFIDSGEAAPQKRVSVSAVLSGAFAHDTYLIALAFFFVTFSTYLVFTWGPSLLADLGYSSGFIGTALSCYSVGGLIGGLIGAKFVQQFGSRSALFGMSLVGAGCALIMSILSRAAGSHAAIWVIVGLTLAGLAIPGTGAVIYVLAGQIYPASIRATGVGTASSFGRFGAVTSAFVGPILLGGGGASFFLATAAAMLVVAFALVSVKHRVERQAP